MESFFVAVNVAIVKITVFIEPKCKTQCPPAALFVHDDLACLKLGLGSSSQPATPPDSGCFAAFLMWIVRPKNRADSLKLRRIEQKLRINYRHVICIKQQNLAKRGVEHRIR